MTMLVRNSALWGYSELVRRLDGSPEILLSRFEIAGDIEQQQDTFLPYRNLVNLLEASADALDCPDFGMRLSGRQGLDILGPVAVIARHADTVGDAYRQIGKYIHVHSPALRVRLDPDSEADTFRLYFDIVLDNLPRQRQINELSLGIGIQILHLLTGAHASAQRVHFRHAAKSPLATYQNVFGTDIRFEQPVCAIDFDARLMRQPLTDADPQTRAMAAAYLQTRSPPDRGYQNQVRELVMRLLPTGRFSVGFVAEQLYVHPRTLQRCLDREQTGFAEIVDGVRCQMARHYLMEARLPLGQITGLLGFAEQSTFNRACRRWFQATPRGYRGNL